MDWEYRRIVEGALKVRPSTATVVRSSWSASKRTRPMFAYSPEFGLISFQLKNGGSDVNLLSINRWGIIFHLSAEDKTSKVYVLRLNALQKCLICIRHLACRHLYPVIYSRLSIYKWCIKMITNPGHRSKLKTQHDLDRCQKKHKTIWNFWQYFWQSIILHKNKNYTQQAWLNLSLITYWHPVSFTHNVFTG